MIVPSNACSLRDARLEGAVVQIIRDWATAYPNELIALDKMVHSYRDAGSDRIRHGDGKMRHKAEIPTRLYWMLDNKLQRGWIRDPRTRKLVFSHFKVGMVARDTETTRMTFER